ncbi:hypothetical protein PDTA9759_57350 (plasmid) [Phytobacter diazotrophicus]|uniref:Uncharacterized protein n=1 Tax=Phytobacter diazotrophicus TaxID=395631 RepID=A0ABN6LZY8_9ENTR|nr:hypothetical protein PDTA9734_55320 [Phytobacter diazotrophicus]BEG84978.1 hypothetical protein PDTA9730_54340 [Phytobacter diazotrophicus]BEG91079.1 hypothetical protein PDTA9759_57350 [Phytobacter diazotrophicus]BEG96636.1 hypothetical protein PDTA9832_54950 [Phytobacter diazotrophicus]
MPPDTVCKNTLKKCKRVTLAKFNDKSVHSVISRICPPTAITEYTASQDTTPVPFDLQSTPQRYPSHENRTVNILPSSGINITHTNQGEKTVSTEGARSDRKHKQDRHTAGHALFFKIGYLFFLNKVLTFRLIFRIGHPGKILVHKRFQFIVSVLSPEVQIHFCHHGHHDTRTFTCTGHPAY